MPEMAQIPEKEKSGPRRPQRKRETGRENVRTDINGRNDGNGRKRPEQGETPGKLPRGSPERRQNGQKRTTNGQNGPENGRKRPKQQKTVKITKVRTREGRQNAQRSAKLGRKSLAGIE